MIRIEGGVWTCPGCLRGYNPIPDEWMDRGYCDRCVGRAIGEALLPAMRRACIAMQTALNSFRAAGLIPPPASSLKHGTVWTSLDGEPQRVRGRRGRPQTFHWGRP